MSEDGGEIEINLSETKTAPERIDTETHTGVAQETEIPANTTEQEADKLEGLHQGLEVGRKTRKAPKYATRYNQAPQGEMFGESAGTSRSFIEDSEKYGTIRAVWRLAGRAGVYAETGDESIFQKDIDEQKVGLRTRLRGATIVALTTPQMLVQAGYDNRVTRFLADKLNPYPRLFSKEMRAKYQPPVEFQSGTFTRDETGNLVRSEE